jgi:hypothetical protein
MAMATPMAMAMETATEMAMAMAMETEKGTAIIDCRGLAI